MNISNYKTMDPFILLSVLNTKLRDFNPSLEDLCSEYNLDMKDLKEYLKEKGFTYMEDINQIR